MNIFLTPISTCQAPMASLVMVASASLECECLRQYDRKHPLSTLLEHFHEQNVHLC